METIDDRKDNLVREGTSFRSTVVSLFEDARKFKVGFWNSIYRKKLRELERRSDDLLAEFIRYDERTSQLIVDMATARQTTPAGGSPQPIDLNTRFVFAIYSSQAASQRETIRGLIEHLGGILSNHRGQANNLAATLISVLSLVVAVISLGVAAIAILK